MRSCGKVSGAPRTGGFCDSEEDGGAVHRCLHAIMHFIEDHAKEAEIPVRFAASKLAEGDVLIRDSLKLDENEKETLEHIICQMEAERGLDRAAAIAHMRFDFIEKVCDETVIRPKESKEHIRSQKIDRILTGKYTALPMLCRHYGTGVFPDFQRNRIRPVRSARCRDYGAWKLGGCAHDSVERKRCDSFSCDGRYF